ncbi:hypothetical protein [Streptomyces sp. 6N223]|uniref:hypothetical protein n=1 Tax=Streptomyces sp. 6N223 TaxID=3457412 RepID=UPI003FD42A00
MSAKPASESDNAAATPMRNERGVIAEHYYSLQSLSSIEAARESMIAEPGTKEALLVGLYQSTEIALHNLTDLLTRASDCLSEGDVERGVTLLHWVRSFHRVLVRLSLASLRVSADWPGDAPRWAADTTPGFSDFLPALRRFDEVLSRLADEGKVDLHAAIGERSLEDPWFAVLHCARIANHDARVWSANLAGAAHPAPGVDPERILSSANLRHAVDEHQLSGHTYFTQFRALHQIPELLVREINDRIETAIRATRGGDIAAAVQTLDGATELFDPIEACLPPIVDNLSTHDYHQIRENLGLTSGSHSVSMRFHLFTDLYEQLVEALAPLADKPAGSGDPFLPRLRQHAANLRIFIFAWRDMHLHLPRNNLGGQETKSLTGAPDAIRTVRKMRDNAVSADPMSRHNQYLRVPTSATGPLADYLDSPDSSDTLLLAVTGQTTQANFRDVQERRSFFSQPTPFTKPPRRDV